MLNKITPRKLIIVADDFTGANDTGVQFRKSGLHVHVIIDVQRLQESLEHCDVLVVDLESRFDTPEVAYKKCFDLGRQLFSIGNTIVYKKLDSTFRGNIGAEIDGLMDALRLKAALLAPALPANGRTTEHGEVYVHRVRLAETEACNDPRTPVKHSRISDIIRLQSRRGCCEISTALFKESPAVVHERLMTAINAGLEILIFDSRVEKDLQDIARAINNFGELPILIAGSAGLAGHLRELSFMRHNRMFFVFSGSVSAASRGQVKHAVEYGHGRLFFVDGKRLLDDDGNHDDIMHAITLDIEQGVERFIFTTSLTREDVESVFSLAHEKGITQDAAAEKVASGMGKLAALLIQTFNPAGVLLTGGETAIKTVQALHATGISIDGEILPGIQSGTLSGCPVRTVIATKAGGFGASDAITKTLEFFKK